MPGCPSVGVDDRIVHAATNPRLMQSMNGGICPMASKNLVATKSR